MRIVVWNCAMGLHRKWDRLVALQPDVAIVAECAQPEIMWRNRRHRADSSTAWIGDKPHKGLAVFAFGGRRLETDSSVDARFKYYLPVRITGETEFSLLAVWAFNHRAQAVGDSAIGEPLRAVRHYERLIETGTTLVAGDFNNSVCWDRSGKPSNFSDLAAHLHKLNLRSAYHDATNCAFGEEENPTFFHRKGSKGYHIDYCFMPRPWTLKCAAAGRREEWIDISDHVPLIVDFAVA